MTDETKDIHKLEPAFPRSYVADGHNGMTLRDWFAGQAIGALIEVFDKYIPEHASHENMAKDAYKLADAMLTERSK